MLEPGHPEDRAGSATSTRSRRSLRSSSGTVNRRRKEYENSENE